MRDVRSVVPKISSTCNAAVLAINTDDVATRKRFAAETGANFPLLADTSGEVVRAYGAMGENRLAKRITVVIGPDSTIQAIDGDVDSTIRGDGPVRTSLYSDELALMLSDWKATVGSRIPRLFVSDAEGKSLGFRRGDERASVLLVVGDRCAASRTAVAELETVRDRWKQSKVSSLALCVENAGDGNPIAYAKSSLVGYDRDGDLRRRLGVKTTPWAFIVDGRGVVKYSGPWSDRQSGKEQQIAIELVQMLSAGRPLPVMSGSQKARGTSVRMK